MSGKATRRQFLQTTAATGIGFWVAAGAHADKPVKSANDRVAIACIGVGGKGRWDAGQSAEHGDVVAICDIDELRLKQTAKQPAFKKAKAYTDFRKMFDELGKSIDAVTVSTADHCHAAASLMAMRMGIHCYCQKPLTRTVYEARLMGKVAKEQKVATQMGNQGTAEDGLRETAALIQAGAIGDVSEVHVWTNRPVWSQGGGRPASVPCPKHVKWDLWLGPAPTRPYAKGYHPFSWRGYWDFGSGALGDMACHTMNMPYMALGLRNPAWVEAETWDDYADKSLRRETFPKWSLIRYHFDATDKRPAVDLFWYDGGKLPNRDLFEGRTPSESGALVVGSKGKIYSPQDYGREYEVIGKVALPKVEFTKSPGLFAEWINAMRGGPAPVSNFTDYSGPLTEMVLLGNLAIWSRERIIWDPVALKAKGVDSVDELIKPTYRKGYVLDV